MHRLIGTSRATDLVPTGRAADAAEALHIGLANRVVPAGQALDAPARWPSSRPRCRRPFCTTTAHPSSTRTA